MQQVYPENPCVSLEREAPAEQLYFSGLDLLLMLLLVAAELGLHAAETFLLKNLKIITGKRGGWLANSF